MKVDTERLSMEKMDRSLSDAMERAGQSLVRRLNKYPDLAVPETTETTPAQENLVVANLDRVDRILPAGMAMVPHDHKRAGTLFAHAAHFKVSGEAQAVLPGFETQRSQPALPLELYDLSGGPSNTQGRGAPLALRLLVESILAVGLQDRGRGFPVVLRITLRDFLARLYPRKIPDRRIYWPRLWRASEALDRAWIPWLDPTTKKGGIGRFVLVSNLPRNPGAMDDEIKIIVDLPPGVGAGPMVSPRLATLGA